MKQTSPFYIGQRKLTLSNLSHGPQSSITPSQMFTEQEETRNASVQSPQVTSRLFRNKSLEFVFPQTIKNSDKLIRELPHIPSKRQMTMNLIGMEKSYFLCKKQVDLGALSSQYLVKKKKTSELANIQRNYESQKVRKKMRPFIKGNFETTEQKFERIVTNLVITMEQQTTNQYRVLELGKLSK